MCAAAAAVAALFGVAPASLASVDSELAFHRGVVAFGDGRYEEARIAFQRALDEDPEDTAAMQYLGMIAQEQGDLEAAVGHFQNVLALEPDNHDVRLDLGSALIETGDIEAARSELDQVLAAEPDNARANLFAGIAAYRAGSYQQAIERLDRAKQLDPSLAAHASYYAGLSAAFLGNFAEAEGAFSAVEEQSPLSPLSRSAESLRQQITPPAAAPQRPWTLALTAGIEWDSNPTFAGKSDPAVPGSGDQHDDFRGVFRVRGSYDLIDAQPYFLSAGYDGYLSAHHDQTEVDLQTHVGWLSGGLDYDPVRFGLRYDYAFTMIDLADKFRSLNRITPSVTYRESDWGVTQGFFQWQNADFLTGLPNPFDRDSNRYTIGVNQFLFVAPFTYLRVGALGEFNRADSPDFSYDGLEVSGGAAAELPFDVLFTALYRFLYRDYRSVNAFPTEWGTSIFRARRDTISRLTVEFARPIGEHFEASIAGSFDFNDSNIDLYDYNRSVVGAYLSYLF